ncbi:LysM peptidoglycan-binding domain-containing protein [Pseudonocardia sichuanensis]
MNEPDHEKLRRELETAASRTRDEPGARRTVIVRNALIGLLVAVPAAAVVLLAVGATDDTPPEPTDLAPTDAVTPQPPRPTSPRPPATSTGPGVPPQPEPAPDAGRPTVHTVAPGETLARIALHHGVPIERIAEQNGLADPDLIRADQTLEIPRAAQGEVVIAPGATLGAYADRHGTTIDYLLSVNPHITDPGRIVAGCRLRVA